MYDIKSNIATDFIDHNEILESIAEAREKAADREYVESLIERSKDCKGLSHREAATLLECDDPELTQRIFDTGSRNQAAFLWQPHSDVCSAISLQLLRQRMRILPLSSEKQDYPRHAS